MRAISKQDWQNVELSTAVALRSSGATTSPGEITYRHVFSPTDIRDVLLLSYDVFKFTCIRLGEALLLLVARELEPGLSQSLRHMLLILKLEHMDLMAWPV